MGSTYLVAIFVSSNVSPKTRWQTTETQGCQVLSYLRASVPHSGQRSKFFLNSLLAAGTTSISIKDAEYPLQLHVHRVLLNEVITPCSAHAKNRDRLRKVGTAEQSTTHSCKHTCESLPIDLQLYLVVSHALANCKNDDQK